MEKLKKIVLVSSVVFVTLSIILVVLNYFNVLHLPTLLLSVVLAVSVFALSGSLILKKCHNSKIIIGLLILSLVFACLLMLNVNSLLNSIVNNLYIVLMIASAYLIVAVIEVLLFFKRQKSVTAINIAMLAGLCSIVSYMLLTEANKTLTIISICLAILAVITEIILVISRIKYIINLKKGDRYIRLDAKNAVKLDASKNSYAEYEIKKTESYSAFYAHKGIDASAYFNRAEDKNASLKSPLKFTRENVTDCNTNNYNNAFMDDYNYSGTVTNNKGQTMNFDPDPYNAKYYKSNMADGTYRSHTDVEKLNKEFLKNNKSHNGGI